MTIRDIFSKDPDKTWAEFLRLKDILVVCISIASAVWGAIMWVDTRYAKSSEVSVQVQSLEGKLLKSECELTTVLLSLSSSTLKDQKAKERDTLLKTLLMLKKNPSPTDDQVIEMYKIQKDIDRIESFLDIMDREDKRNDSNNC
jgi:hypothetical protein